MHWGSGGYGMPFFWIFIVIMAIILFKMFSSKSNDNQDIKESPVDILKRRYASGEIDKSEYQKMKKDIEG